MEIRYMYTVHVHQVREIYSNIGRCKKIGYTGLIGLYFVQTHYIHVVYFATLNYNLIKGLELFVIISILSLACNHVETKSFTFCRS